MNSHIHSIELVLKIPTRFIYFTTNKAECDRLIETGCRVVHEPNHKQMSPFEFWVLYGPLPDPDKVSQPGPESPTIISLAHPSFTEESWKKIKETMDSAPRICFLELDEEERSFWKSIIEPGEPKADH